MTKTYFNPGCALSIYKPEIENKILKFLNENYGEVTLHKICCGDDFYPKLPIEKVHQKMKERADSMPCNEVCVYYVSCIKSMYIGGKTPRHLIDLLIGQTTEPQIWDTVKWHEQLQDYIDKH
ncbi:MAG: hypothetical protein E6931_12535 [Clostridium botulinum]|nr:hypothetical protein [Clostridium botulinum]